jgi:hypothetical protein
MRTGSKSADYKENCFADVAQCHEALGNGANTLEIGNLIIYLSSLRERASN